MFIADDLVHLTGQEITEIHDLIIAEDGGLAGSRPDLTVDALVGRIQSNLTYQAFSSVEEVAALYAEVIARGHVYQDGNKRTALVTMLTFLDMNGYALNADQIALADKIVDIAKATINFRLFAAWLKPKLSEV